MNKRLRYTIVALLGLHLALVLIGCGRSKLDREPWGRGRVEVAPGNFIEVDIRAISSEDGLHRPSFHELHVYGLPKHRLNYTETYELRIHWNGTNVHWKGNSIPQNLRAYEGRLFLITFDRVTKGIEECEFRYYAQQGNELKEIPPSEYPKAIAGNNLIDHRYFMGRDREIDAVQLELDMDPKNVYFQGSMTAFIWNHLTTGQQYHESMKRGVSQKLLEEYIRTNQPIKLTSIVGDVRCLVELNISSSQADSSLTVKFMSDGSLKILKHMQGKESCYNNSLPDYEYDSLLAAVTNAYAEIKTVTHMENGADGYDIRIMIKDDEAGAAMLKNYSQRVYKLKHVPVMFRRFKEAFPIALGPFITDKGELVPDWWKDG